MTTRPLLLASAVVVLTGCAGVRGWVRDAPAPTSHGSTRPETYYAAGALPVHAKPSDASKVVGRLAPNTRVMRTQVDRGWARIAADGVEGWVDASHLVHQPPPAGPPAPAADGPAPAPTPPAPAPEAAAPPPDPAPSPAPDPAPAAPASTPAPSRPPPAVEDPF